MFQVLFPVAIIAAFFYERKFWTSPVKNPKARGCDALGCGKYLASRDGGTREHKGLDLETSVGQKVYAPISGMATTFSTDRGLRGVLIKEGGNAAKVIYINPANGVNGRIVKKGEIIGWAIDIRPTYGSSITNHVHFEALINGAHVDPVTVLNPLTRFNL